MDLTQAKKLIAQTALTKMLKGRYFDICTIDNLLEMLSIRADKEYMSMLRPLHCVHWSEMSDETRNIVHMILMDTFGREPENVSAIVGEIFSKQPPANSLLSRNDG